MSPATREALRQDHALLRRIGASAAVKGGPFTGLKYSVMSHGSAFLPKICGTYERELHAHVEFICQADCDLIVDIGAAEGYYAVGLARRCKAPVVAFEMNERARAILDHIARRNRVRRRVRILGLCQAADLRVLLVNTVSPVIICDCEGAERDLLDPDEIPTLAKATMLVETHETDAPGVTKLLIDRFQATHDITVTASPDPAQVPPALQRLGLPPADLARLVDERRGQRNSWLMMTPDPNRREDPSVIADRSSSCSVFSGKMLEPPPQHGLTPSDPT